ncbi:hypothetical protein GCM10027591_04150 [Zhihengliuella somnathii]
MQRRRHGAGPRASAPSAWARAALASCVVVLLILTGQAPARAESPLFDTPPPVTVEQTRTTGHTALLANRARPISPSRYVPSNLTSVYGVYLASPAASALRELVAGASRQGHSLRVVSGYRSYDRQRELYNYYVSRYGRAYADSISALPGTSEHQLGLAVDVGSLSGSFGTTAAGRWVAANAHRYGFVVRYPDGYEHITGYRYEPWHLRYLGRDLAQHLRASRYPTYEQFVSALETWEATPRPDTVGHTFKRSIDWLYAQGITGGYSNGLFGPDDAVTRLEMAAFLYRYASRYPAAETGVSPTKPPYRGIGLDHSYVEELGWSKRWRIASGYTDGSFGTGDPITRGQLAAFLMNYAENVHGVTVPAPPSTSPFTDIRPGGPHYEAITWLASTRITGGFADGAFRPWKTTTRGEMAAFLQRLDTYLRHHAPA